MRIIQSSKIDPEIENKYVFDIASMVTSKQRFQKFWWELKSLTKVLSILSKG